MRERRRRLPIILKTRCEDTYSEKLGAVGVSIEPAVENKNNANIVVPEGSGMDPDVLAALPDDIRQELIEIEKQRLQDKNTNRNLSHARARARARDCFQQEGNTRQQNRDDFNIIPEGSDLDPDVLAVLPDDIRREIIEQEIHRLQDDNSQQDLVHHGVASIEPEDVTCQTRANISSGPEGSDLDPDVLAALPDDIRQETIEQVMQRPQKENLQREIIPSRNRIEFGSSRTAAYEGEMNSLGERHGKGKLRWHNGDTFKGDFRHGLRNGIGTLTLSDGSSYSGGWKDDKCDGCGTRRFPSGCTYTGGFQNNKFNGHGQCAFSNGESYIGGWKDGVMEGQGSYFCSNGDIYEGMFRCNKRHGPGRYKWKDGKEDAIRYKEGMRVGYGVQWSPNKRKVWLLEEMKQVKRISNELARQISRSILDDTNNAFAENLEYHIPSKEGKTRKFGFKKVF